MPETNGGGSGDRLERVERIVEALANTQIDPQQNVKIILRAQVVMGDTLSVMGEALAKLAEAQKRTEESLRHTDQRMDALILTVDEIVRGRKQQ